MLNADQFHVEHAFRDKNVVTANGTAPIEFAQQTLEMLGYDKEEVKQELDMYKIGFYTYVEKYGMPEF